ncbi:MAG TPA: YebC/PmpR family DNA-binding transcriptional regulator [Candidatus Saccharimonadales bacterium]|nr:YebC/PmpR family DNA-binding transcriptional regulator [Candidatus Saccharimonadales bacterium]
MSGHSKWSTIKRQKGTKDQKRGQVFTKLSYSITTAVREGGGVTDPNSNFRLRLAVEEARAANMPKENITRAIDRASGSQAGDIEEIIYEGFGPGGFSVVVETLTDKKQRTIAEVKNAFDKNGGSLGVAGSVLYQFEKKGMITVGKDGKTLDEIFLIAADSGAEDIEDSGDDVIVYTRSEDSSKTRIALSGQGLKVKSLSLFWKPVSINTIADKEKAEKAIKFVELLEELDDVHKVYVNFDIQDNIMEEILGQ